MITFVLRISIKIGFSSYQFYNVISRIYDPNVLVLWTLIKKKFRGETGGVFGTNLTNAENVFIKQLSFIGLDFIFIPTTHRLLSHSRTLE